jgi:hypothetical protein
MQELELLTNIGAIGVIGIFIYFILKPLIELLVQKLKDKMNGTNGYSRLETQIKQIEGNHLTDVHRRLDVLERRQDEFLKVLNNIENRLIRIETKLE